jgi:hypothetical protein
MRTMRMHGDHLAPNLQRNRIYRVSGIVPLMLIVLLMKILL